MAIIEVSHLEVSYQNNVVLKDINFEAPEKSMIGIIGPNGSGKTTLLKSIMGLVPYKIGKIKLFGKKLNDVRQKISYVPQRSTVDWDFPASVWDVVLMGRLSSKNMFKRFTAEDKDLALQALKKVEMDQFSKRQIGELSGGQQQRIFLARALAQQAELYFLDEPFAAVDMATENTILNILKDMQKEGKTIVVVHHDLPTVRHYFDWIVLLNQKLIACGSVQDVFQAPLLQLAYNHKLLSFNEDMLSLTNF
jgi:manganese/zinc/iron transport system ATP- binding protein